MHPTVSAPLHSLLILDFLTGPMSMIGKTLADLGANVVRVESFQGDKNGRQNCSPTEELEFMVQNAGKQSVTIDISNSHDRDKLDQLVTAADILLLSPSSSADFAIDPIRIREKEPTSVVVSVSDFGTGNAYSEWKATDPVLHALSGTLSRSGLDGRAPLIPPGSIALGSACSQAVFVILTGYYKRLKTGHGMHIDFSTLEGCAHALDPGFGIGGSAAGGVRPGEMPRGRPQKGVFYPILKCADGYVRICVLSPSQWQAMFKWMGCPEEFSDPKYNLLHERFSCTALNPAIEIFFSDKTRDELASLGERHGVPVAPLLALSEVLDNEHYLARDTFQTIEAPNGQEYLIPNGIMSVDGHRLGSRQSASPLNGQEALKNLPLSKEQRGKGPTLPANSRPLEGLKVLDMGIIIVGADQSRLLADQGANVIKIESSKFPDGSRQISDGKGMSLGFASGHRNKRSLGINLRNPQGRELFLKLVEKADIVLSNFKPGTLGKLQLDYETMKSVNPNIITVESSAFGATGPWAGRLGYGPLVRSVSGLTQLWRYPDDENSFSDSVTVYPDHTAARYGAIAALALLIRRELKSCGGQALISQADVMLNHLSARVACAAAGIDHHPHDAPWGVYPCAGEDEWCVVTVSNEKEWQALCRAIGRQDLLAHPELQDAEGRRSSSELIDGALSSWLANINPFDAMKILQEAGVPAGGMLRVADLPSFGFYQERQFFRNETHPALEGSFIAENAPTACSAFPAPETNPAPLFAQHTEEVIKDWLGLGDDEVLQLIAQGVLERNSQDS